MMKFHFHISRYSVAVIAFSPLLHLHMRNILLSQTSLLVVVVDKLVEFVAAAAAAATAAAALIE